MRPVHFLVVLACAVALTGCFYSIGTITPSSAIGKPFAASGTATVKFPATDEEPAHDVEVRFEATDSGYRVMSMDGQTAATYELGDIGRDWFAVAEILESGRRNYGLIHRKGKELRAYDAPCSALSDKGRELLGLTMSEDRECVLANWDQLRRTMDLLIDAKALTYLRTYVVH